jgi:hypothetical protein
MSNNGPSSYQLKIRSVCQVKAMLFWLWTQILMPRLNWINPTAFSREIAMHIISLDDKSCTLLTFFHHSMWLVYGGFPFLLLKNCNIDLRHFTKRILQIVPLRKEEQWCDKVTMYSRERNGGGERGQDVTRQLASSRLAKGTNPKATSIPAKMHRNTAVLFPCSGAS